MLKVIRNEKQAYSAISGTFRVGQISADYMGLELVLGDPTFDTESPDGKVQVEWVVNFKGNIFTIYDWKTYDRDFTLCELDQFNIGGNDVRGYEVQEFISFLEGEITTAFEQVEEL